MDDEASSTHETPSTVLQTGHTHNAPPLSRSSINALSRRRVTGGLPDAVARTILYEEIECVIRQVDAHTGAIARLFVNSIWRMLMLQWNQQQQQHSHQHSQQGAEGERKRGRCCKLHWINVSGLLFFASFVMCAVVLLVACVLKFTSWYRGDVVRVLVEFVCVAMVLGVYVLSNVVKSWRDKTVLLKLLKSRFESFKKSSYEFSDGSLQGIESMRFITVCRDNRWVKIPYVLLVKGDLIYTNFLERDVEFYGIKYKNLESDDFYVLEETMISKMIRESLPPFTLYRNLEQPLFSRIAFFTNVFACSLLFFFTATLIMSIVRVVLPYANFDPIELLMLYPMYTSMFVLPIGFPLVWIVLKSYSNARISALFAYLNSIPSDRKKEVMSVTSKTKNRALPVPLRFLIPHVLGRLIGLYNTHNAAFHDMATLGSVTVLNCVDKDGILTDVQYVPEKLFVLNTGFKQQTMLPVSLVDNYSQKQAEDNAPQLEEESLVPQHEQQPQQEQPIATQTQEEILPAEDNFDTSHLISSIPITAPSTQQQSQHFQRHASNHDEMSDQGNTGIPNEDEPNTEVSEENPPSLMIQLDERMSHLVSIPKIFDLMFEKDAKDGSIKFQDEDWKNDENMKTLKPLGLNFLINSSANFENSALQQRTAQQDEHFFAMRDDLSSLWKKHIYILGKEIGFEDNVLDSFAFLKRIYTKRKSMEMSAVIVDYDSSGMQIHSHGHPEILLEYCADYWDGQDVRPLSPESKNMVLKEFNTWSEQEGLYCLAMAYKPIDPDFNDYIHSTRNDDVYIDDGEEEQLTETSQNFTTIQQKQIFLGMVALRKPLKDFVTDFINEFAHDAGIRFTYMSNMSTQRTKALGRKLGLETDWNSCISLSDKDVKLDPSDYKGMVTNFS